MLFTWACRSALYGLRYIIGVVLAVEVTLHFMSSETYKKVLANPRELKNTIKSYNLGPPGSGS